MVTGLRPKTFEKLQLNAGAFLVNFDYESATDKASLASLISAALQNDKNLIGATLGGGTFAATPTYRTIEVDGMRAPFVGSEQLDMWDVKLTTTMKEITPDTMKYALSVADIETSGSKHTLKLRTHIDTAKDYIKSLCWVGDTSKGYVLIELDNALNLAGATLTFVDKGEGSIPVEFTAHQANLSEEEYAPCRIVFFDAAV